MIDWIESKWNWYKCLPWYWKILAAVPGLLLLILGVFLLFGRSRDTISSERSEGVHTDYVNKVIEEKVQVEEELKKEIEESKKKVEKIIEKEKKTDVEIAKVHKDIDGATSVDEVRQILKGL